MDELKFRRQAYEDPHNQDADFLAQINAKPENQALINELKNLDAKLSNALKVDVAEDLADKLILRQQLQQHHKQRRQTFFFSGHGSLGCVCGRDQLQPITLRAY